MCRLGLTRFDSRGRDLHLCHNRATRLTLCLESITFKAVDWFRLCKKYLFTLFLMLFHSFHLYRTKKSSILPHLRCWNHRTIFILINDLNVKSMTHAVVVVCWLIDSFSTIWIPAIPNTYQQLCCPSPLYSLLTFEGGDLEISSTGFTLKAADQFSVEPQNDYSTVALEQRGAEVLHLLVLITLN